MTRILHVLDHSLPMHSGYTFRTRAILKAQHRLGLTVAGVTGNRHTAEPSSEDPFAGEGMEWVDGLCFYRTLAQATGSSPLREWREIGVLCDRIVDVAKSFRPDVLHAHSPALNGMAALKASKILGIPLVYEIRAFWEDAAVGNMAGREGSPKYWLTRQLENRVVSGAQAVVTICDGLRRDLIARGHDARRMTLSPNGVDLALFGAPLERNAELSHDLGLDGADVIGFIGSFYDYEGLDVLIDAMPGLVARHPRAALVLVGGGPMEAGLRVQAEASSARDAIHFIGRVPHHDVDRYYSLMDVMAYPRKAMRLTELVTPLKPLEAMAQGKLVAASDVGGHRELVTHDETGILFAPDSASACADALAGLLADRDSWPARIARAREHVAREHDWAENVQRYLPVYQRLLTKQSEIGISYAA